MYLIIHQSGHFTDYYGPFPTRQRAARYIDNSFEQPQNCTIVPLIVPHLANVSFKEPV